MPSVNCGMFRGPLIELARGTLLDTAERRALTAHLEVCQDCGRELEEQSALTAALRGLAGDVEIPPAETLESRLLAEFDAVRIARRRRQAMRWMPVAAALVIAAFLGGRMLIRSRAPVQPRATPLRELRPAALAVPAPHLEVSAPRRPATARRAQKSAVAAPVKEAEASQPFIAIPYTLPLAPGERSEVLRMDLPVSAVIAAGLPLEVADSGAHARADVLVGEDGRARAIRLISISTVE
jgi:hypothetical protein